MKSVVLAATAAILAFSGATAHASSEPRCWYGKDRPHCTAFQSTNATGNDASDGLKPEITPEHETDHARDTTRPY